MEEFENRIGTDELKQIQFEILCVVADFCEKNDIRYWLDFGTLIGAVRHKGYIPWDDDIDISMSRADYDKFLALFNQENKRYQVYSHENNKDFMYAYAKILDLQTVLYEPDRNGRKLSVNIDLFPYDAAPPSHKKAKKIYKKRDFYNKCMVAQVHTGRVGGGAVRRLAAKLLKAYVKLFRKDYFVEKIIKNAKKYANAQSGYVCDFCGNMDNFVCEKALIDDVVDVEFENKTFKAPVGYDKLLRLVYGDYMQFPPEEKRVSHHKFEAYRISE